ncbi:MAG: uroporphyrinogen-III C-methyltransferase, partial [Acidimicrobiales bacterium]
MGGGPAARPAAPVTVYLVGAGPGDPGLLTRRGADLLARADVVVYDRLVDPALLALAPPGAMLVDAGRAGGGSPAGTGRQEEIDALLALHGVQGRTVVRLKGGDPFLFGRGGEEAEALTRAGVAWEVVPGVSSATAVPAYAGVPVTHRGLSTSVTVVTGRVGGSGGSGVDWEALARIDGTLVVLMGMASRSEIARRLVAGGRPADTPVAVVEWGTTPQQRAVRTTLAGLADVALGAPAVVVVGPVAALDLTWAPDRPLAGTTVVVTRARGQAAPLTDALQAAGARVVEVPVVEIADPDDGGAALRRAAQAVASYDWVAFTSANAVHRFVPLLRDSRGFGPARLAAVGDATAEALAAYNLVADLVPERTDGAAGAEALAAGFDAAPAGGRVLFPRAQGARRALPDGLAARGWAVDEVVAYRSVPAPPPPAAGAD